MSRVLYALPEEDMDTISSKTVAAGTRGNTRGSFILQDIFGKHFRSFSWFIDSATLVNLHGWAYGFTFIIDDHPIAVEGIERTFFFNGHEVGIRRTIFVEGISKDVTKDTFKDVFSVFGTVLEHEIVRDRKTKEPCGYGFIIFDSEQAANFAVASADSGELTLSGSKVSVKKAELTKSFVPPANEDWVAEMFSYAAGDPRDDCNEGGLAYGGLFHEEEGLDM